MRRDSMHFIQVGMHYRTNDITVREKFVIEQAALIKVNQFLHAHASIHENIVISTCNRTEVYAVVTDPMLGFEAIFSRLAAIFHTNRETLGNLFTCKQDDEAIEHLLRVTAGLDSMIVGETEILGQVKHAFYFAKRAGTTNKWCHEIFKRAITAGKKVQHVMKKDITISSISHFAVSYVKQQLNSKQSSKIIVVGAGVIGQQIVQQLAGKRHFEITLANRTVQKAEQLTRHLSINCIPIHTLQNNLSDVDAVIVAIRHDEFIITNDIIKQMNRKDRKRLHIIDLGVPRNVEPAIDHFTWVSRIDMDDIQNEMEKNNAVHLFALKQAEKHIVNMHREIKEWMNLLPLHEHFAALRQKGDDIQSEIIKSLFNKIPTLTEREKIVIEKHTQSIINQLLKDPMEYMKQHNLANDNSSLADIVEELFQLSIPEEKRKQTEKEASSCVNISLEREEVN